VLYLRGLLPRKGKEESREGKGMQAKMEGRGEEWKLERGEEREGALWKVCSLGLQSKQC